MKMKISNILAECTGFSPILFNPMNEVTLEGLRTGVHVQLNKDRPVEEIIGDKIPIWTERDGTKYIGVRSTYLFAAVNGAGRNVKNGKKALATAKSSTLPSIFFIDDRFLKFGKFDDVMPKIVADQRRGCLPKDGTAVCLVRPMLDEWQFTVRLRIDESFIKHETALKVMEYAGRFQGLGDYRPEKKGPHGIFTVTKWIVNGVEFNLDKWNSVEPELDEPDADAGDALPDGGEGDLVGVGTEGATGNGAGPSTARRGSRTAK